MHIIFNMLHALHKLTHYCKQAIYNRFFTEMVTSSIGKVYQTDSRDKDAIRPKATTTGIIYDHAFLLYLTIYVIYYFWYTYNRLFMCLFTCADTLTSANPATTHYDQPHEQPVVASSRGGTQGTHTYVHTGLGAYYCIMYTCSYIVHRDSISIVRITSGHRHCIWLCVGWCAELQFNTLTLYIHMHNAFGHSTDNPVETILQEFRNDILNNVNAKEHAAELRRQKVIAESTEIDIERARGARKASGILYDYLYKYSTLEQIRELSKVLKETDSGFGRTTEVGRRLYKRIQRTEAGATGPK